MEGETAFSECVDTIDIRIKYSCVYFFFAALSCVSLIYCEMIEYSDRMGVERNENS